MPARLLLLFLLLLLTVPSLHAQAPGTVRREDIDGSYHRPDLSAPLFDAAAAPLDKAESDALVRTLVLVARNFPDSPVISHRLRSHSLAVALRLRPDDRAAVVANGQLARGITPQQLPCDPPATVESAAAVLYEHGAALVQNAENARRRLGLLLLDLASALDPRLRRKVSFLTYLAVPDWYENAAPGPPLEAPHTFTLHEAFVQVLLPGLKDGTRQFLTIHAKAVPSPGRKGLRVSLPQPLLQAMDGKNGGDLRARVERRMTALRTTLRARHETWPDGWSVDFDAASAPPEVLPSLFAGMALTLDALLSGEPLDDRCLLAAGMDGTGRLHPVVSATELFSAPAFPDSVRAVILSDRSAEEVMDWLLLNPDQWPLLFRTTLHQSPDIVGALVLSRKVRAPRLAKALQAFDEVAARLTSAQDPLAELRRPETVAALREVLTWHAGHLSASALLRVAVPGTATFSIRGSLARIDTLARPILSTDRKKFPLHIPLGPLAKSDFAKAADTLIANVRMFHPEVREYVADVVALGKILDRATGQWKAYLKENGSPDPPDAAARRRQVASSRAALEAR